MSVDVGVRVSVIFHFSSRKVQEAMHPRDLQQPLLYFQANPYPYPCPHSRPRPHCLSLGCDLDCCDERVVEGTPFSPSPLSSLCPHPHPTQGDIERWRKGVQSCLTTAQIRLYLAWYLLLTLMKSNSYPNPWNITSGAIANGWSRCSCVVDTCFIDFTSRKEDRAALFQFK